MVALKDLNINQAFDKLTFYIFWGADVEIFYLLSVISHRQAFCTVYDFKIQILMYFLDGFKIQYMILKEIY